ncbi:peptidoglycan recognition protein 3-like [Paramacrobiotus metropolitanus]|uniref:peptidoglycan recognition protein 3-like n=1 Tax=Paramacrobiotus metropolitanus TaxID=2943436 RepID=UPI002446280A|nr:peptidoglycan recognition protein 3-like [Paramacrobiotus metropolitanus]
MKEENCTDMHIVRRSEWSLYRAADGLPALPLPTDYMVYTHTFGTACFDRDSCVSIIREIQNYHMAKAFNYSEIGYNFLIGGDGIVYEGRGWHTKGVFKADIHRDGIGVAFIGKLSSEGDCNGFTYAAAASAHKLLNCAIGNGFLRTQNQSGSVLPLLINPSLKEYILNPAALRCTVLIS